MNAHLAALLAVVAAAAPAPSLPDHTAFEELQRIAARRPDYSEEVGKRLSDLITQLWTDPTYRLRGFRPIPLPRARVKGR